MRRRPDELSSAVFSVLLPNDILTLWFGGYGGGTGRLDDFWSFDFESRIWEEVQVESVEKPGCRENNGVVISDSSDSIYLFGGYDGGNWLNDLWKFDIESKRWTCIQGSSDAGPADEASSLAVEESGHGQAAPIQARQVRGKVPSRRFGYVSVVHAGRLILWGGFDGTQWLNCMHEFSFATKTWREIQPSGLIPSVRSCPAWAKDDTHVYIHGGYDGVERKSCFFACDLSTYCWTQMPSYGTCPSARYFHSCCLYDNKYFVYGGYSGNERLADMHCYDFVTNHWTEVDCTNGDAPSGRSSLVCQVHESVVYIFGGYNGTSVLNDFHRFRLKPVGLPPPSLVSDFRRLINNAELADVSFVVEGKVVHAHRAVLACRSEYFRVMLLTGGMKESQMTDGTTVGSNNDARQNSPIHLQDVSYSVFLQVLEFLYTDTVARVSLDTGIHLMIASEHFMLDRLKSLCEDAIRRDLDLDNCIDILVASHRHRAGNLKEIALEFIMQNLGNATIQNGLSSLKPEAELLVEILQRTTALFVPPTPQSPTGDRPNALDDHI
ncbi:RCC1 and BTB domain-containing protein 2 [Seminavis robusta]|uniref:RCC1 and BTB domain-containing protein 2 n=1 Tax=Seminavis robusta TaxID=568900 RepID=A0A9N8HAK3_9STRA|nr:RCC1 and BTB domain-containing protein 2 [Seminavis robusta]|eukprot:Sro245_g097380.1 RCC1 and BTB domain-containing protein 2 (550) ;mRNA; f:37539-40434